MDMLNGILQKRKDILTRIAEQIESSMKNEPEGSLRACKKGNLICYYHRSTSGSRNGRYLDKSNTELIKQLGMKNYNRKLYPRILKQLKSINDFLNSYDYEIVVHTYEQMPETIKPIITPYEVSDENYAEQWQNQTYKGNPYPFENESFVTAKGEKVRSKSEIIIANGLYAAHIPYHFGKLDSDNYRNTMMKKIEAYSEAGLTVGHGLIVTFEDYRNPLSAMVVNEIIKNLNK